MCRALNSTPQLFAIFLAIACLCALNVNLSSISTPKNFSCDTRENVRPERKRIELSQTSKVKKMKNEINVQYKYNKVGHRMSNYIM